MNERVTLVEFDSLEQAIAARESAAYQAAFANLGNVREMSYGTCGLSKRHRKGASILLIVEAAVQFIERDHDVFSVGGPFL